MPTYPSTGSHPMIPWGSRIPRGLPRRSSRCRGQRSQSRVEEMPTGEKQTVSCQILLKKFYTTSPCKCRGNRKHELARVRYIPCIPSIQGKRRNCKPLRLTVSAGQMYSFELYYTCLKYRRFQYRRDC